MSIYVSSTSDLVATFKGNILIGDLVEFHHGGIATKSGINKEIVGVCVTSRGGLAGIKIKGVVTLTYTGTEPSLGYTALISTIDNQIKVGTTGKKYLVLDVDTIKLTATILL